MEPSDAGERLLFECLERLEADGPGVLESMCAEHPEHARELREGVERLAAMGLISNDLQPAPASFPDRLDEYRLIRKIGSGGMGVVFLAEHDGGASRVALKAIRPDRVYYQEEVARFRREFEAIAQLRHPGIVTVIKVGQDREIPYFVMEWLEGASLSEVLERFVGRRPHELTGADMWKAVCDLHARSVSQDGAPDDAAVHSAVPSEIPELFRGTWCDAAIRVAREVADALHYSHKRGILHRDVKPSNIWITPAGRTVLIDFGLARPTDTTRLTRTGAQLGSLLYMSPEQVTGAKDIDERADVYSLGVTFYETLAFRNPFEGSTAEMTVRRIVESDTRAPRSWNSGIPRDVQTVCMTAMNRDVDRRYRDARELSSDLGNLLEHRPIIARRPGWILRLRRWTERHPARAVGVLLLAAIASFAVFTALRERNALRRIQLLADTHWIETLTEQARSFWPMDPDRFGEIESWLTEIEEVREQHEVHRRELEALRARALPYTHEAEAADRADARQKIAGLESELRLLRKMLDETDDREAFLATNGREIDDLESLIAEWKNSQTRRTWSFADRSDRWRHAMLMRLVENDYRGILELESRVRSQLERMHAVHRASIIEPGEAWREAIDEIARLDVYDGLRLTPQMGLRPLRRNPVTGLWEFLHVPTGAAPRAAPTETDPARLEITEASGIVLVLLPAANAEIGFAPEPGWPQYEFYSTWAQPTHRIELDAFFISAYEMTVAQWLRLGGELPPFQTSSTIPTSATWEAIDAVLKPTWLDFPTEAQWEYACRGGTSTVFYTGDTVASLAGHANIADRSHATYSPNAVDSASDFDDGYSHEAPVGSFLPNPYGLYDMHGNVNEWTADIFVSRAYQTIEARPGDGLRYFARDWLDGLAHGVRGGSFWEAADRAPTAFRRSQPKQRWRPPGIRPIRRIQ